MIKNVYFHIDELGRDAITASALKSMGIDKVDEMVNEYISLTKENAYFKQKRNKQNKYWLLSTIEEQLKADFYNRPNLKTALEKEISNLEKGETTPFIAAKKLINLR